MRTGIVEVNEKKKRTNEYVRDGGSGDEAKIIMSKVEFRNRENTKYIPGVRVSMKCDFLFKTTFIVSKRHKIFYSNW